MPKPVLAQPTTAAERRKTEQDYEAWMLKCKVDYENDRSMIYEVTIKIKADLADDYQAWLDDHVKEMENVLFYKDVHQRSSEVKTADADIEAVFKAGDQYVEKVITYIVPSYELLSDYLTNGKATVMRSKVPKVFNGHFVGSRDIRRTNAQ
jgi:hypothetical protein